ncbi:AAA family ATPase [Moorella sp. E306M]|uniref:AAA family ATPase n=1 Tax=Moorella sp. E306M TaxID=2572683 RepID=UPI0010FFBE06|nr:AAA family ATPase [Moorella sp. E306M]GEA17482.1 hypothetical protein E306M_06160 [Moorella sp. E306M]
MIITHLNEGPKAEYSLNGTVLTVHGVSVDLAARQRDVQTVIDISLGSDFATAAEGTGAWYVATIVIPPREYDLVDTGQVDENGNPVMTPEPKPLDMNKVELRLWALPRQ